MECSFAEKGKKSASLGVCDWNEVPQVRLEKGNHLTQPFRVDSCASAVTSAGVDKTSPPYLLLKRIVLLDMRGVSSMVTSRDVILRDST
jgi:hypothetical protein